MAKNRHSTTSRHYAAQFPSDTRYGPHECDGEEKNCRRINKRSLEIGLSELSHARKRLDCRSINVSRLNDDACSAFASHLVYVQPETDGREQANCFPSARFMYKIISNVEDFVWMFGSCFSVMVSWLHVHQRSYLISE